MQIERRNVNSICPNCFGTLDRRGHCPNCAGAAAQDRYSLALPLGMVLNGRYLIGQVLGVGGFGITYRAWDMKTSACVAVKEFFPKGYATRLAGTYGAGVTEQKYVYQFSHWMSAFVQEAQILTSIKTMHGIVKLLGFFQQNNTAYIVMEYLEGVSLRQYLNLRGKRIPLKEALNIMRPVLDSLFMLHQHGIIHKDISPENIIVVKNKYIKLIDFGAASIFADNSAKPYVVLKSGYSPAELYTQGSPQGPWSDVYEAAATIYTCITGSVPPSAPMRQKADNIIRPSRFGIKIPLVVENCLLRALAINPSARFNNMGAFIQTLYGEFLPRI